MSLSAEMYVPQQHAQDAAGRATEMMKDDKLAKIQEQLYVAVEQQRWKEIDSILKTKQVKVTDRISINGNTALHVAVACHTAENKFLERMLDLEPESSSKLLDVRNSDGSTLLHLAASLGNIDAITILVTRNRGLLLAEDNQRCTPLDLVSPPEPNNTEAYLYLLDHSTITDPEQGCNIIGNGDHMISDERPLINAISGKDFKLACELIDRYKVLKNDDDVLMAIAQHFPCDISLLKLTIYELWRTPLLTFVARGALDYDDLRSIWDLNLNMLAIVLFGAACIWPIQMLIWIWMKTPAINFLKKGGENRESAGKLLEKVCGLIKKSSKNGWDHNYSKPIFEAVKRDACDFVQQIVCWFPNAIKSVDKDGHNIAQAALKNRSLKVMAVITHGKCAKHTNISQNVGGDQRPCGNSLLHFAARLAPASKLSHIAAGAYFQIQFELQWFKVAKRLLPLCIKETNNVGETPEMVFTREHSELEMKGEKWLKDTANSGLVTATLLITITFAAAITVPGGNDDGGIPEFAGEFIFTLFAIFDALSMLTSTTSLLLFLSIFTSSSEEEDFVFPLHRMLLSAFATLFMSASFMVVAFGATLALLFGHTNPVVVNLIVLGSWVPISCFGLYLKSLIQLPPDSAILLLRRLRLVGRIFI